MAAYQCEFNRSTFAKRPDLGLVGLTVIEPEYESSEASKVFSGDSISLTALEIS